MNLPDFSPQALADLRGILNYISKDNPQAAQRFVTKLKEHCFFLASAPESGTVRDDLVLGLRAFTVGNYVIYFRSERGGVRVERVLHGAQDVDALIFE